MRRFFDTNILVYALDPGAPAKRDLARASIDEAIADQSFVTSTQVLAEFYTVAVRRKFARPNEALNLVRTWGGHDTVSHTFELVLRAIELHQGHSLSPWDALVVQAALDADCGVLLTEDMQHGRQFGALEIVNPFIATGAHEPRSTAYRTNRRRRPRRVKR